MQRSQYTVCSVLYEKQIQKVISTEEYRARSLQCTNQMHKKNEIEIIISAVHHIA